MRGNFKTVILRRMTLQRLGKLDALEFDVGGAEAGEVVVGLLGASGFGGAAENFGEADGHFGGDGAFPVDEFGPRNEERFLGLDDVAMWSVVVVARLEEHRLKSVPPGAKMREFFPWRSASVVCDESSGFRLTIRDPNYGRD